MAGLLQQLENNEAVLLMYLAGELPPEDRAEVERMLTTDAAMRASLAELRLLSTAANDALARLDSASPQRSSPDAVVRRTMRGMRQHELELASRKAPEASAPARRPWPWWSYPAAAAAAAILGFLVWWGNEPMSSQPLAPEPGRIVKDMDQPAPAPEPDIVVEKMMRTLEVQSSGSAGPADEPLATAERHLRDLETSPNIGFGISP